MVRAYCPNTSRLIGLLNDQPEVWLTANADPDRKTAYTVKRIRDNDNWVGIHASQANELYEDYLHEQTPNTEPYRWEREVKTGNCWIDFRHSGSPPEWVEVKSLSSKGQNDEAFFSGTPSKRARKHLHSLAELVRSGDRARCVFVVQRQDVQGVSIQEPTHPDWIEGLQAAVQAGVEIEAYRCRVSRHDLVIDQPISVDLTVPDRPASTYET